MIRHVGILGGGGISETHARAAAAVPDLRVVAVCGRDAGRVEALAARHGAVPFTDIHAFLRHRPMEIVAIGTPSGVHADDVEAAAAHGLHVLCEKPLDVTTARIDRMLEAVARAGVTLGVFFQDRSTPDLMDVKDALVSGRLGRPILADARVKWYRPPEYYAQSLWRGTWALDGGGALMNQGVHTVDLLLWLLGDVRRVYARTLAALHAIEVEDTAVAVLEFASGAVATLEATTAAWPGYDRRVSITGTLGTVVIEQARVVTWDVREPALEGAAGGAAVIAPFAPAEQHRRSGGEHARRRRRQRAPAGVRGFRVGARHRPPAAGGWPRGPAQRRVDRGDLRLVAERPAGGCRAVSGPSVRNSVADIDQAPSNPSRRRALASLGVAAGALAVAPALSDAGTTAFLQAARAGGRPSPEGADAGRNTRPPTRSRTPSSRPTRSRRARTPPASPTTSTCSSANRRPTPRPPGATVSPQWARWRRRGSRRRWRA